MGFLSKLFGENEDVKRLKELPITPVDSVPECEHPNAGYYDGRDYTDPAKVAQILSDKSPAYSQNYITGYHQGGGLETKYSVYRIAESTWRLVEQSRYTD